MTTLTTGGGLTLAGPRFDLWARADLSGGPEACWPWGDARNDDGYGRIRIAGHHWYAHRLAYLLARGPIPAGAMVCHHCDNPPCVNPAHLFMGYAFENARDKVAKGRQAMWRPTQDELVLLTSNRSARAIAAEAGVSIRTIYRRLARVEAVA